MKISKDVRMNQISEAIKKQGLKLCPKCKTIKPRNEFYSHRSNGSGVQSACKVCQKEYDRTHRKPRAKKTTAQLDFDIPKIVNGNNYVALTPIQAPGNSDNRIDQVIQKLDTLIEGLSYFFKG